MEPETNPTTGKVLTRHIRNGTPLWTFNAKVAEVLEYLAATDRNILEILEPILEEWR